MVHGDSVCVQLVGGESGSENGVLVQEFTPLSARGTRGKYAFQPLRSMENFMYNQMNLKGDLQISEV